MRGMEGWLGAAREMQGCTGEAKGLKVMPGC